MGFKIPNFSQQMGGSPFHKKGSPLHDAKFNTSQYGGRSGGTSAEHKKVEQQAKDQEEVNNLLGINDGIDGRQAKEDNYNAIDYGDVIYAGFGSDAWENNFTIQDGKRVDKYGNSYADNPAGFAAFQEAAKAWNADQAGDDVINPDNVEPLEVAVNPNEHTPSEGINILSNKQIRAAKRVARLRNKASKRGGLTEGQSKRLNRNIDKAQGDEVAYGDRTKVGQFLKGKPVDPNAFTKENMDPYGDEDPFDV